jgi:hypothetical protein
LSKSKSKSKSKRTWRPVPMGQTVAHIVVEKWPARMPPLPVYLTQRSYK